MSHSGVNSMCHVQHLSFNFDQDGHTVRDSLSPSLFGGVDFFETQVGSHVRRCHRFSRVRVYRNLNKPEFFSIQSMDKESRGLVLGYARSVLLRDVTFVVSEASRKRVIREKKRNVHAFCVGLLFDASNVAQDIREQSYAVTYNPYVSGYFYREDHQPQQLGCPKAILQGSKVHVFS